MHIYNRDSIVVLETWNQYSNYNMYMSLQICFMTSITDRRKKTSTIPQRERQHQEKAEGGRGLVVGTTIHKPHPLLLGKSPVWCVSVKQRLLDISSKEFYW